MKNFRYAIFLIALSSAFYEVASVYKCASELETDTCYLEETIREKDPENPSRYTEKHTFYIKACPKGKICTEYESKYLDISEYPEIDIVPQCIKNRFLLEEGKKCKSPNECITNKCTNNKCSTVSDGESCEDFDEYYNPCKLGSFCSSGRNRICIQYKGKDETCGNEETEKCGIGLVCYNHKCVPQFSVENGLTLEEIDKHGYYYNPIENKACKSGESYYNNKGEYQCGEIKKVDKCKEGASTSTATIMFSTEENVTCDCTEQCERFQKQLDHQPAYKKYIEAFNQEIDNILKENSAYKFYQTRSSIDESFGIEKLRDKWIDYHYIDEFDLAPTDDDKECLREFIIRQLKSNYIFISIFNIILCVFALL